MTNEKATLAFSVIKEGGYLMTMYLGEQWNIK